MADVSSLPYIMPVTSEARAGLEIVGGTQDPASGLYAGKTEFLSGGGLAGVGNGDAYRAVIPKAPDTVDNQGHSGFGNFVLTGGLVDTVTDLYTGQVLKFNDGIRYDNDSAGGFLGVKMLLMQTDPGQNLGRPFIFLKGISADLGFATAEDSAEIDIPNTRSTLRIIGDSSANDIAGEWIYIEHHVNVTTRRHEYSVWRRSGLVDSGLGYSTYSDTQGVQDDINFTSIGITWESCLNSISDADASYDICYLDLKATSGPPSGFLTAAGTSGVNRSGLGVIY